MTRPVRRLSPEAIRDVLAVSPPSGEPVRWETDESHVQGDYALRRVRYPAGDGDTVSAFLLHPAEPSGAAVVAFHQHNRAWHLGKSEVAGLAGAPLQALGPALAAAGITVLAPDAVGFEDRRRQTSGTESHPDDERQHQREFAYRLVQGDTLARKVLADAAVATSLLLGLEGVDPARVGAVGHSFGGHTTLFHSAIDERIRYACVSGAVARYCDRIAREDGIAVDHLVPGIAERVDFDELVGAVAPRPLLLVAGDDDDHGRDTAEVAGAARPVYAGHGAADRLRCEVRPGGHALTPERHALIVAWVRAAGTSSAAP